MTARFSVLGLVVEDMAASLAFYRRLGLTIPEDADTEPHVEAPLPGGLRMTWDTVATVQGFLPGFRADGTDHARGGGGAGLAFLCDDPADVDRVYARMTAAGHEGVKEPWDAFWGQRYAVLHDPDGNGVDLFAPL